VPCGLPSVFFRALGKEALCRVLNKKHSAKKNTRQRSCFTECKKKHSAKTFFAECQKKTLGKEAALPSAKKKHSAKKVFAECFF